VFYDLRSICLLVGTYVIMYICMCVRVVYMYVRIK